MKIAHISDLHLLALEGNAARRFLNKRFTGWVNLRYRRKAIHKPDVARAVARELRERDVDHVVITGDVTNLALESEFELVRRYLEHDLGFEPSRVSMVPGNHDVYTQGSHRARRFQCYFGEYITTDLPDATSVPDVGRFPYVRLRGPVAFIGLSSAVPRPILMASGHIGPAQRAALHALLGHEEVRRRLPVILQHHPFHNPPKALKRYMNGLEDADAENDVLQGVDRGLLLHGHLHRRVKQRITTGGGHIDAVGSTSASLLDPRDERMGGFNLYEVDDEGQVTSVETFRLDTGTGDFVPASFASA